MRYISFLFGGGAGGCGKATVRYKGMRECISWLSSGLYPYRGNACDVAGAIRPFFLLQI